MCSKVGCLLCSTACKLTMALSRLVQQKRPYAVKLHMHVKRQMLDKRCKDVESTDELTKQRRETHVHYKRPQCGGCKLHLSLRASCISPIACAKYSGARIGHARKLCRVKQVQLVKHLCLLALALGHSTVLCDLKDLSCEVVWSNGYTSTFTGYEPK